METPYKENLNWVLKELRHGLMYEIEDSEGNFVGIIGMKRDAQAIIDRQNYHAETVRLMESAKATK